jgi:hypothetical protein
VAKRSPGVGGGARPLCRALVSSGTAQEAKAIAGEDREVHAEVETGEIPPLAR